MLRPERITMGQLYGKLGCESVFEPSPTPNAVEQKGPPPCLPRRLLSLRGLASGAAQRAGHTFFPVDACGGAPPYWPSWPLAPSFSFQDRALAPQMTAIQV